MAPNSDTDRQRLATTSTNSASLINNGRLHLFIDGQWYDLTQWQHIHPGGDEILRHMNGKDATDAFYSLHGHDAIQRLSHLKPLTSTEILHGLPSIETTDRTRSFRQLRQDLFDHGYFHRSIIWELFYYLSPYILCLVGTWCHFYCNSSILAIIAIGLGMEQAGWIGHDYVHGRGQWMYWMGRTLSGFINAFSPTWWSHKHNTHHVYANNLGIDTDIANEPIFHLFFPSKDNDVWFRSYQHMYYLPVFSLLYLSWRWQSMQHACRTLNYREFILMLPNYVWLYMLGWQVALGSIIVGGLLVAVIVTATHQSEDILMNTNHSFVETQFLTTCDARCDNIFMEWLWGGMQYQLEHHLFPTMPKYNYARIRPIVEQWAKDNRLTYKCQSVWSIWHRNYRTLKYFAR
jgi:fatty acid desaturase